MSDKAAGPVRDDAWWAEKHALLCGIPECRSWQHHQELRGPHAAGTAPSGLDPA